MNIKGVDKATVEEDMVGVKNRVFITIMGDQDTTHETTQTQCICHADIVLNLTM